MVLNMNMFALLSLLFCNAFKNVFSPSMLMCFGQALILLTWTMSLFIHESQSCLLQHFIMSPWLHAALSPTEHFQSEL